MRIRRVQNLSHEQSEVLEPDVIGAGVAVIGDVFRRRDASGWKKTAWLIFLIFVPFLGVFAYLIANSDDMAARNAGQMSAT